MRDDLLDTDAAINWGKAQLPVLEHRFLAWQTASIEIAFEQSDTDPGKTLAVAQEKLPFPLMIHAEAGAIINSFRSSLDLLAAALAKRNGVTPSHDTHFPIFRSAQEFADPLTGIEGKKWLSKAEIEIVKSINPYEGGSDDLWSLHQLDIKRKHERLITLGVRPYYMSVAGPPGSLGSEPVFRRLENKTVLFELPRDAAEPQITATLEIIFDEVNLPAIHGKRVVATLYRFATAVRGIIDLFDGS